VVGEISESFRGWKFCNLECDNFQHDIFKAKPDSRYINAIQRNFPEVKRKSPSYFLATTGTGKTLGCAEKNT